jgi:hypothetical protein
MYFEIGIVIFVLTVLLFLAFWLAVDGTHKQKHKYLGVFARFIQKSARRAFLVFFFFTIMMIPVPLLIVEGYWIDSLNEGNIPSDHTPIVGSLLLMFLMLSAMIPVMWGRYRIWRQAAKAAAEVRVRTTT